MILCVFFPFFAARVEQQQHAEASDELLALSENTRVVRRIAAVSEQAATLDIRPGMLVRHAQAFVPEISVLPLNPPRYRQALDALLKTLYTFSDRIELTYRGWGTGDEKVSLSVQSAASSLNPAVLFLDIGMLKPQALFNFGKQLQDALRHHHLPTRVGIAANRFTAWVAAQSAREGEIVYFAPGEEQWMLMCHPVSLLPLNEKTQRRLWWLGIRTLGDFARLPRAAMRAQFGKAGQIAYQLAHGIDPTPVQRLKREREISRSVAFEAGVSDRQIIDEALKKLTSELLASLEAAGETTRRVRLTLILDNHGARELETKLRHRTNSTAQITRKLQKLLESARLAAPISEIQLILGDLVPTVATQLELFPAMRVIESRQAVLDDLVACYGEHFFIASIDDDKALFTAVDTA